MGSGSSSIWSRRVRHRISYFDKLAEQDAHARVAASSCHTMSPCLSLPAIWSRRRFCVAMATRLRKLCSLASRMRANNSERCRGERANVRECVIVVPRGSGEHRLTTSSYVASSSKPRLLHNLHCTANGGHPALGLGHRLGRQAVVRARGSHTEGIELLLHIRWHEAVGKTQSVAHTH